MFSKQQTACSDPLIVMFYKVPNEESKVAYLCHNSQSKALATITSASDKHLGKLMCLMTAHFIQYIEQGESCHSRLKSILNYFIKR